MTIIRPNSISGINSITAKNTDQMKLYDSNGAWSHVRAGVITATTFIGNFTGNVTGTASQLETNATGANLTLSGNLGVGGTITYEDVARVDATGISTFREGFGVGPLAGIALTAYADGSIRTVGIITATNLKVGPSNSTRPISIYSASDAHIQFQGSGTGTSNGNADGFIVGNGGTNDATLWNYENGYMRFATNNAERLRIDSSGRLNVGRTDAISKIGVTGTGNASTGATNLGTTAAAAGLFLKTHSGSSVGLALGGRDTGGQYIQAEYEASTVVSVRDLSINPYGGGVAIGVLATAFGGNPGADTILLGTSQTERLRINASGSFGIGGANYGSSGQVIKSAGSGAAPAWGPMAFSSFAVICDKKGTNDDGGSATAGNYAVYDVRNLNHELADPDSIVSISSNQFTLVAGTYWVEWKVPAYGVDMFTAELINVTDGTGNRGSAPGKCDTGSVTYCHGSSYFTISASKTFEIRQHNQTARSGNGLGVRAGYSNNSVNETFYTFVYIYKK